MKIKQFIEKSIEGGYELGESYSQIHYNNSHWALSKMWLDPKAWEAVGKVEGWMDKEVERCSDCRDWLREDEEWKNKMRGIIDHLIWGKSLESYIETL